MRGNDGGRKASGGGERARLCVIVDDVDVEFTNDPVRATRMDPLDSPAAQLPEPRRRSIEGRPEPGARVVLTGSDQGHLVSPRDEPLDQVVDNQLDAAVVLRRDLEPGRRDDRDPERSEPILA